MPIKHFLVSSPFFCDRLVEVRFPTFCYLPLKIVLSLAHVRATLIPPDLDTLIPTIVVLTSAVTPQTRAWVVTNFSNCTGSAFPGTNFVALAELWAVITVSCIARRFLQ